VNQPHEQRGLFPAVFDEQIFVGRAANTDITVASALALVDALNRCVESRNRGRSPA